MIRACPVKVILPSRKSWLRRCRNCAGGCCPLVNGQVTPTRPPPNGVNSLRRFIIEKYGVSLPPAYDKFLKTQEEREPSKVVFLLSLFIPASTYQFFTAIINSLSWGFMVSIAYYANAPDASLLEIALPGVTALIVTLIFYSVYSRLTYQMKVSRATVSVEY